MGVAMFDGNPVSGPRGEKGPDGNPIGTIISYMGTIAPKDYLICDGSTYNISDYPELSSFFKEQFGASSYFGGNGTTTFAVPDMRNLFLRGYHGSASDKLSGDIGKRQDGTEHLNVYAFALNIQVSANGEETVKMVKKPDKIVKVGKDGVFCRAEYYTVDAYNPGQAYYTSRPVNMAVLYCIKVN